jgi:uncharacterized protein DUF6644
MLVPESLVRALQPWNDFYSHSKAAEIIVTCLHVGGLLLAGGLAIGADRGTFRAMRYPVAERPHHLRDLADVHKWVLGGLAIVFVSGLLLFTADVETFAGSWLFWAKMALVLVLLVNGFIMTRTERVLAGNPGDASPVWRRLHRVAVASVSLWFVIAFAGVALLTVA